MPQALNIPLKGSISITSVKDTFNETKISEYRAGTAKDSDGNPDPGGSIRVVLKGTGGGCDSTDNGPGTPKDPLLLTMTKFWQAVTLSNDKRTLFWDLTGPNVAHFHDSCRLVQREVEVTMNVKLPFLDSEGLNLPAAIIRPLFITNNPQGGQGSKVLPCMTVTNSCLAAGTQISMADGSTKPIESVKEGDQVYSPYDPSDSALAVADTAKGVEVEDMVRIQDEGGRSLLMTAMHPMPVADKGMVLARYLRVGDKIMTREGPSRLVKVTREDYKGTVYNLKVGSGAELKSLGEDQTVVYANGFLVGDGRIQSKYEAREEAAKRVTHRLPIRWKTDYVSSARR